MTPQEHYQVERAKRSVMSAETLAVLEAVKAQLSSPVPQSTPTVSRDGTRVSMRAVPKKRTGLQYALHRDPVVIAKVERLAAEGKRQREIANALGISENAVSVVRHTHDILIRVPCVDCSTIVSPPIKRCVKCYAAWQRKRKRIEWQADREKARLRQRAYRANKRQTFFSVPSVAVGAMT